MTVIAAVAQHGQVVMAADTATNYEETVVYGARKIRRLPVGGGGEALVAAAGNGAIPAVVASRLKLDAAPSGDGDADRWAESVAVAVTEVLAEATPPLTRHGNDLTIIDGALLLGSAGRLWYVFTSQAVRVVGGVAALGSGTDLALGVMHALLGPGPGEASPLVAVTRAVDVACKFDPWCGVDAGGPLIERLDHP